MGVEEGWKGLEVGKSRHYEKLVDMFRRTSSLRTFTLLVHRLIMTRLLRSFLSIRKFL